MVEVWKRGIVLAFAALTLAFSPIAAAAEPTAIGVWKILDPDTKQPSGLVQVREKHGQFEGYIIKMFSKPGDPVNPVCTSCTDDRKDKPVLGIRLMQNLKRDGLNYEGGTILDPRNGTEYNVKLAVSEDGQTLTVRGFVGVSLFGQSQEWKRLTSDEVAKLDTDPDARPLKDKKDKKDKKKKKKKDQAATPAPAEAPPTTDAPPPATEPK